MMFGNKWVRKMTYHFSMIQKRVLTHKHGSKDKVNYTEL